MRTHTYFLILRSYEIAKRLAIIAKNMVLKKNVLSNSF